ncbi:MAG: putative suppressor protein [Cytophagaceae bacterium]|jgi:RNA polymerase-binding transcription factor DksA|nr:putative suppressor protein [Cytophagaceae bacterium]
MAKVKKVVKKTAVKKAVAKKKAAVKKPAAKKSAQPAKPKAKPAAKKTVVKKAVAKKAPAKNVAAKKAVTKKVSPAKKAAAAPKKAALKKTTTKKVAIKETLAKDSKLNSKTVKPQAIMQPKNNSNGPEDTRTKYSEEELKEFETLILEKLERAKKELVYIKESLSRKNDESSDNSNSNLKLLEDGADTLEKENFSQLAARQMKFIQQLEFAVIRIKNGTYGVCIETGKLIPKERLRAVPHTQHSIEAKLNRK